MDMKVITGLVAGALLLATYYVEDRWDSTGPLPQEYAQGPEALNWLRKSNNESALASNRFGATQNAIQFVQQLYDVGAERVIVPLASITKDEAEVYADSLVVTLPSQADKRERVWKLCAREIEREGGKPGNNSGDNQVLLWWD
jgi:hypothetical protein